MLLTRKLHAHGELYWWLILLTLATALMSFLAREARGDRVGPERLAAPACCSGAGDSSTFHVLPSGLGRSAC